MAGQGGEAAREMHPLPTPEYKGRENVRAFGIRSSFIVHRSAFFFSSFILHPSVLFVMDEILFYLFAGIVAAGAIGVAASRNIIRTAVYLLFALAGVSGIYLLLGAEFLAAVQLVIYVGGTLILIIFGVMLTSTSPKMHFEPTKPEAIFAAIIGGVLLIALCAALSHLALPSASPSESYSIQNLGAALLGPFLLPFEMISVLLLVVMIGAAYLAKGRRRQGD
ncbi:MAG TPA: NADH-quinone oxidoreductase subunit J [Tepidisphaeraceae bacterium]|jgi:NADH-quinone oxidoreductase subunit J